MNPVSNFRNFNERSVAATYFSSRIIIAKSFRSSHDHISLLYWQQSNLYQPFFPFDFFFLILCKMKTKQESKVYTQKIRSKIWTLILTLWLTTCQRAALIFCVSCYISKFIGNYWLSPYNLHLVNFSSESCFLLSVFLCHIYDSYAQSCVVPFHILIALQ